MAEKMTARMTDDIKDQIRSSVHSSLQDGPRDLQRLVNMVYGDVLMAGVKSDRTAIKNIIIGMVEDGSLSLI